MSCSRRGRSFGGLLRLLLLLTLQPVHVGPEEIAVGLLELVQVFRVDLESNGSFFNDLLVEQGLQ